MASSLLLLLGFCVVWCPAFAKIKVPIGVVLLKGQEDLGHALHYAFRRFDSEHFEPHLIMEVMDKMDYVQLSSRVCQLLHHGIVTLVSPPGSLDAHRALVSYSNTFHVPLVSGETLESRDESPFGVSVKPNSVAAATSLLEHFQWPSFFYLYDSDEGLKNLQMIQDGSLKKNFQAERVRNAAQAAALLSKLGLKDPESVRYVVLDTSPELAHAVVNKQIKETMSFTQLHTHFILLRPVTDDFWHFRRPGLGSVNVTALALVDPEFPPAREFHKVMRKTSPHQKVSLDAYLYHDAAIVLLSSFANLLESNLSSFEGSLEGDHITFNGSRGMECYIRPAPTFREGLQVSEFLKRVHTSEGLTGNLQFNEYGERVGAVFQIISSTLGGRHKIGTWSDKNGLVIIQEPQSLAQLSTEEGKSTDGLEPGKKFVVTSILTAPYLMLKEGTDDEYDGYVADLVKELSNVLGFEYKIRVAKDAKYGTVDANGTWGGLVRELINKEADMAVADLTITAKRMEVVDFSLAFIVDSLGVISSPCGSTYQPASSYFFLVAFSRELWLAILCVLVAFSVLSFLLSRLTGGPDRVRPRAEYHQSTLCGSFWFSTGSFFLQSTGTYPRSASSRILTCFWWFFVLLVVVTYLSQMTVFLLDKYIRLKPDTFSNEQLLQEVLSGQRDISVLRSGSTHKFIESSQELFFRALTPHLTFVPSMSHGFERVKDGGGLHSFIGASSTLLQWTKDNCHLVYHRLVDDYARYGIAFSKGSPYSETFSRGLQKLRENEFLTQLKHKWLEGEESCTQMNVSKLHTSSLALTLRNTSGMFCIVLTGFVLALLVGCIEFCVSSRREARKTKTSMGEVMWLRAQSSMKRKGQKEKYPVNDEEHSLQNAANHD